MVVWLSTKEGYCMLCPFVIPAKIFCLFFTLGIIGNKVTKSYVRNVEQLNETQKGCALHELFV